MQIQHLLTFLLAGVFSSLQLFVNAVHAHGILISACAFWSLFEAIVLAVLRFAIILYKMTPRMCMGFSGCCGFELQ